MSQLTRYQGSSIDTEWKLDTSLLHEALNLLNVAPTIDLFASRINYQFPRYVSFQPDPVASAIDAFAMSWSNDVIDCFLPFNLLCRVLRKIQRDQAEGVEVAPLWRSQVFWPSLTGTLTATQVLLSHRDVLLMQPSDRKVKHPLRKKLELLVCKVSGVDSKHLEFLTTQPTSSCRHGDHELAGCMTCTSKSGQSTLMRGRRIHFNPL